MSVKFVHLNLHTEYSIVDGMVRIEQLLASCVAQQMAAIAVTDQSNLFALVKFYQAAIKQGVKPIVGAHIWLENSYDNSNPGKLLLLAQNQQGYHNLLQLISRSFLQGQHLGLPIVKTKWLTELASNIIALSGGKEGDIGQALLRDDLRTARQLLKFWQKIFPERYYLELQRTGRNREEEYIQKALTLAELEQAPVVATNAVRFLQQEDFEAHEARVSIHSGYVLTDPARPRLYSDQQYLRSPMEMAQLFQDIPESLENSVEIAKRCSVELTLGKTFLPIFPVAQTTIELAQESNSSATLALSGTPVSTDAVSAPEETPRSYFEKAAQVGLEKRLHANFTTTTPEIAEKRELYYKRLSYEIAVINQMGFASYFLIVADFINWAKQNNIPVGPGRGSGAGSLVAYALAITDLDPLEHDLLFERFLNPERVSLPDFDIDFCVEGRDRVIEYVVKRYGQDKVAQIITYGTMAARAVVRDVGRVLGYPYGFVDKIAKLIPFELGINLERALQEEELLQQRYQQEEEVRTLIDLAKKLEGITRNAGKHAGGVVIAPSHLTDFMPLYCEAEGEGVVTQFDKDDVEKIGLVKFDFLGLRTLTIINLALQHINKRAQEQGREPVVITQIPLDDAATYALLQAGNTAAIFQLESRISRDLIKRILPDCFTDLVALVAIIRPGVLQSGMLDEFIDRKHGRAPIVYLHPKLEPVLRATYGVVVYQEQVMQMAQILAGYSLGAADLLRRAMGKKKPEEMALQRAVFLNGAAKNGIDKHLANTIFDLMEKFAGYGFNKSHSAAYALISYQTAWLKAHYPAEFMAAVLSSDMDNTDKVVGFLNECTKLQLQVVPPDINQSDYQFTVAAKGEILYGLGAIKGVGKAAIEAILTVRQTGGSFTDLFELTTRVDTRKVNKRVLEALIYAGALDKLGPNRASMLATVETALRAAEQEEKNSASGQIDLFSQLASEDNEHKLHYLAVVPWNKEEQLQHEKEVLGFYLSGHPIERFMAELDQIRSAPIAELTPELNKTVVLGGFVKNLRIVNTKNGNRLAIITLEDMSATIDVTMFAENFTVAREYLAVGQLAIVEGEVVIDNFSDSYRVRAVRAMNLIQARSLYARGITLQVTAQQISSTGLQKLYNILQAYKGGSCPIFITYHNGTATAKLALGDSWQVEPKDELLASLKAQFGEGNVTLVYK